MLDIIPTVVLAQHALLDVPLAQHQLLMLALLALLHMVPTLLELTLAFHAHLVTPPLPNSVLLTLVSLTATLVPSVVPVVQSPVLDALLAITLSAPATALLAQLDVPPAQMLPHV